MPLIWTSNACCLIPSITSHAKGRKAFKIDLDKWLNVCDSMLVWDLAEGKKAAENLGGIWSLFFRKSVRLQGFRDKLLTLLSDRSLNEKL